MTPERSEAAPPTGGPDLRFHALEREAVLDVVDSRGGGLTPEEARARLEQHGPNRLPHADAPPFWLVFLRQFRSPLIYVLAAAGAVSLAIGEATDAGFIFAVLLLNAIIGSVQEWRAEKSSQALQKLLRTVATVLRGGEPQDIDAEEVVVGDVVWLESGARVPADLRLLDSHGLDVDESLLTGESLPVHKDADWVGGPDVPLGDRSSMAFAGSTVARGRAKGVVTGTGTRTEVGRLAVDVGADTGGKPPLVHRRERFTRAVAVAVLAAATLVGLVGVLGQGQTVIEMFLFAVALAVSAIPEGLPVALTVALAVGTTRMAKRGVIVRRLAAVEGLGSCTLIASDKTGTLTCNELTVRAVAVPRSPRLEVTGEGYSPEGEVRRADGAPPTPTELEALRSLARAAALSNEAVLSRVGGEWRHRGDPTEVALLAFVGKLGIRRSDLLGDLPQIGDTPFEPERKYAASFHGPIGDARVFVKGAPERVLAMCTFDDREDERDARATAGELAADGHRVLAFAEGRAEPSDPTEPDPPAPSGLRFLGFTGMIDPLRPGVREAVAACHDAGVGVAMVTGDHPVTALAIARQLGLAETEDQVVTGPDLEDLPEDELAALVSRVRVFARVSPRQKLQIVRAAAKAGHFVAVTGDGVNDAPALREANIGVAMGKAGTDVAREAAELVISDDNFATIVAGIEQGRIAYDNVRKVIYLLISTGAAEIVLVAGSLVAGLPLPLLPAQLLWLNLVTNGIQDVALAFEPREDDVLRRPPRPKTERVFNQLMIERTTVAAVVMGLVAFVTYRHLLDAGWSLPETRNALLLLMVLFEIFHIGNCRSETRSVFVLSPLKSPILLTGTVLAFGVHVAALYTPFFQDVLGAAPVSARAWGVLGALALSIIVAMELHKLSWRLRGGGRTSRPAAPETQSGRSKIIRERPGPA